tara:strand:- start:3344 stop:4330 length:987 start_codon:yes stop_codon:yes gene_type:complete
MNKQSIFFVLPLLLFCRIAEADQTPYLERDEVKEFIIKMEKEHKFSPSELESILGTAVHQERVIRIMNKQPEGTMTWSKYRNIMVSEDRINQAKQFVESYKDQLIKAQDIYGVPAEIIASIIGIETRYGRITGGTRVVDSLMTLSFDYPRRAKFFKIQLEEFLLLSREEGLNPNKLKGSIAGAMGYGQFMPDSYRNYAVDFDNDGIRDIVNNPIDAIGSVANFLSRKGKWSPNKPIAFKAKLKGDEPQIKSAFKPYMSKRELESLGIFSEQTIPMGQLVVPVKLPLESGWEYRIGFDNYYSLSRYNRSKLYVMAVSDFSDEISKFFKD